MFLYIWPSQHSANECPEPTNKNGYKWHRHLFQHKVLSNSPSVQSLSIRRLHATLALLGHQGKSMLHSSLISWSQLMHPGAGLFCQVLLWRGTARLFFSDELRPRESSGAPALVSELLVLEESPGELDFKYTNCSLFCVAISLMMDMIPKKGINSSHAVSFHQSALTVDWLLGLYDLFWIWSCIYCVETLPRWCPPFFIYSLNVLWCKWH